MQTVSATRWSSRQAWIPTALDEMEEDIHYSRSTSPILTSRQPSSLEISPNFVQTFNSPASSVLSVDDDMDKRPKVDLFDEYEDGSLCEDQYLCASSSQENSPFGSAPVSFETYGSPLSCDGSSSGGVGTHLDLSIESVDIDQPVASECCAATKRFKHESDEDKWARLCNPACIFEGFGRLLDCCPLVCVQNVSIACIKELRRLESMKSRAERRNDMRKELLHWRHICVGKLEFGIFRRLTVLHLPARPLKPF